MNKIFHIFALESNRNTCTMNKFWISIIILCSIQYYGNSQGYSEKTYVNVDNSYGQYFEHVVVSGENLFQLSKKYNTDQNTIEKLNNISIGAPISINQKIRIPFDPLHISPFKPQGASIPIYYRAQAKDNIFRISKIYFGQSIESMMRRNKLEELAISIDQEFLIGWYMLNQKANTKAIASTPEEQHILDSMVFVKIVSTIDTVQTKLDTVQVIRKYRKSTGIAYWNKNSSDRVNMFALHKTAAKNTSIKIYNPLLNRTVWAQVIGKFDESLYGSEIDIIISPKVAQSLGMTDKRFGVELEYTE